MSIFIEINNLLSKISRRIIIYSALQDWIWILLDLTYLTGVAHKLDSYLVTNKNAMC